MNKGTREEAEKDRQTERQTDREREIERGGGIRHVTRDSRTLMTVGGREGKVRVHSFGHIVSPQGRKLTLLRSAVKQRPVTLSTFDIRSSHFARESSSGPKQKCRNSDVLASSLKWHGSTSYKYSLL